MKRSWVQFGLYVTSMCIAVVLLLGILNSRPAGNPGASSSIPWTEIAQQEFAKNLSLPVTGMIIQILAILAFSRLCALVVKAFGQPHVIGEMIAGILLGKSVFALLWPAGFAAIFPDAGMPRLYTLSQIGLIFFIFVVGLDLKISELKNRAQAAVLISHVSIVFPFLLGALLAVFIFDKYAPANVAFSFFALFMGIAMSITAFPVLASILQEKKLTGTPLGSMALTCAAVDDVTAWCLLAAVLGIVRAGTVVAGVGVLVLSVVYVVLMLKLVRPLLEKLLRPAAVDGRFSRGQLAIVFCALLGSALITELIGIHALFGAFLAGTIMPQSVSFRSSLTEKIEDLCAVVLLPIFFTYTGIRTQIGLLNEWDTWITCAGIILLAIVGKLVGSALAARWSGIPWRESWALGALMNTRGLMELIVLNIGYDLGILSPTIFAMLVVMAIVTTTMTGPLLLLILPEIRKKRARAVT